MNKILLKITLACCVLGGLSCMKQPKLQADFGPEVSDQNFSQALEQVEIPNPYTIRQNEYSYATRETWVEGRPYLVNQRWAFTVTSMTEDAVDYIISFVHEVREYSNGEEKVSSKKEDRRLRKQQSNTASIETVAPTSQSPSEQSLKAALADKANGPTSTNMSPFHVFTHGVKVMEALPRVTRHNLKFEIGNYPIPEFVKQRSNCGGLTAEKCKDSLKAFYISFDQVNWDENGGQKYNLQRVFSPDVPFFASTMAPDLPGVIQACVTTLLPHNGQAVQITQCDAIKDFTFGP